MDDYLPLAYLNAWEYCQRRFYFEYVLGEMGRHLNDHFQLCAVALCLEEKTGQSILYVKKAIAYGTSRPETPGSIIL